MTAPDRGRTPCPATPGAGLEGVLTVMVETPKIDPPLAVKFRVPEKHHKDKKKNQDKESGR